MGDHCWALLNNSGAISDVSCRKYSIQAFGLKVEKTDLRGRPVPAFSRAIPAFSRQVPAFRGPKIFRNNIISRKLKVQAFLFQERSDFSALNAKTPLSSPAKHNLLREHHSLCIELQHLIVVATGGWTTIPVQMHSQTRRNQPSERLRKHQMLTVAYVGESRHQVGVVPQFAPS